MNLLGFMYYVHIRILISPSPFFLGGGGVEVKDPYATSPVEQLVHGKYFILY